MNYKILFKIVSVASLMALPAKSEQNKDANQVHKIEYYTEKFQQSKDANELDQAYPEAEKQLLKCQDSSKEAKFLAVAAQACRGGALGEYFSETLEKRLILENPKCFSKIFAKLSDDGKSAACTVLNHPTFLETKDINQIFAQKKYKDEVSKWLHSCMSKP